MVEFFNAKMQECGLCTASGRPVITAQIDMEKNYAFLEVCSLTGHLSQDCYFTPTILLIKRFHGNNIFLIFA
jgi:hypothetical protein